MGPSEPPDMPYRYESDKPPSLTVVEAIAELRSTDPTQVDFRLYDYIHPEALDTLGRSENVEIVFQISPYQIHVTESGSVCIDWTSDHGSDQHT